MRVMAKENPYSECDVHVRLDSKEGHASTGYAESLSLNGCATD